MRHEWIVAEDVYKLIKECEKFDLRTTKNSLLCEEHTTAEQLNSSIINVTKLSCMSFKLCIKFTR